MTLEAGDKIIIFNDALGKPIVIPLITPTVGDKIAVINTLSGKPIAVILNPVAEGYGGIIVPSSSGKNILITGINCPKPNPDFSVNATTSCIDTTFKFTDLSTGSPTSWEWDFGDGSAHSILQNPTHKYTSTDIYTITLTSTNTCGSKSISKVAYITVNTSSLAVFDWSSDYTSILINGYSGPPKVGYIITGDTNSLEVEYWFGTRPGTDMALALRYETPIPCMYADKIVFDYSYEGTPYGDGCNVLISGFHPGTTEFEIITTNLPTEGTYEIPFAETCDHLSFEVNGWLYWDYVNPGIHTFSNINWE